MAISPKILDENFMQEVSAFETLLDSKLVVSKLGPSKRVNIDAPRGMNNSHFQVLKQRYIVAGWKDVIWNSDQREGDWLVFEA